jgi:uncharacterized protein YcbX
MDATVAALFCYPVKSCRGVALTRGRLTERGIARDREWMIVGADGRFLTQRDLPRMALIDAQVDDRALTLTAPGMDDLVVPLDLAGRAVPVTIWRDALTARDQGDAPARILSGWLERPARLVRFDPDVRRPCNPQYAGPGMHHAFADGYPVLVIAEASLEDLNTRLLQPLPMNRFRPNIVLSGIDAYDEDHISEIAIGAATLRLVKPCARCRITTTDQATAEVGDEPLATLATYRHDARVDGVTFGVNATIVTGVGEPIAVGNAARCLLDF